MLHYFLFNKPFQVLTQFSPQDEKKTLADFLSFLPKDVYPVGRLDYDSEGLLLLTNDKRLTHQLLEPRYKHQRNYWVQVEGDISEEAMQQLETGVVISVQGIKHRTAPAVVKKFSTAPVLFERNPPVRFRKTVPDCWITITMTEGKNRQVRKMTAAVGYPTLRLVRYSIGALTLEGLAPGTCRALTAEEASRALQRAPH